MVVGVAAPLPSPSSTSAAAIAAVDWRPLVADYLRPFAADGLRRSDIDRAEQWANNATAFAATGSWRARVIDGELYVKPIRVHSHWAERASVLRLFLLALRRAAAATSADERIPDLDLVYAHADNDPTPPPRQCHPRKGGGGALGRPCVPTPQLALFTNSRNPHAGGVPVPEFTWVGWKHSKPWCHQAAELDAVAAEVPWRQRDGRLFFSGGLDNGHHRKELRKLALSEQAAGRGHDLHIRDVSSSFHRWSQFDRDQPDALGGLLRGAVGKHNRSSSGGGSSSSGSSGGSSSTGIGGGTSGSWRGGGSGWRGRGRDMGRLLAQADEGAGGAARGRAARRQRGDARAGKTKRHSPLGQEPAQAQEQQRQQQQRQRRQKKEKLYRNLQRHFVPPVPSSDACRYKYGINVPGFGYSSRLRSLLRCGAAVVHVDHPSSEFFVPMLRDGVDFYVLRGREPVRDALMPLLRRLAANETAAAAAAAAGRAFANTWLSFDNVVGYLHTLLRAYGALFRARGPPPHAAAAAARAEGFAHVTTEEQLRELFRMCAGCPSSKSKVAPSCAKAPGSDRQVHKRIAEGGYPKGTTPPCSLWPAPGGGPCLDARCCVGWDCGTPELGCARSST